MCSHGMYFSAQEVGSVQRNLHVDKLQEHENTDNLTQNYTKNQPWVVTAHTKHQIRLYTTSNDPGKAGTDAMLTSAAKFWGNIFILVPWNGDHCPCLTGL